MSIKDVRPEDMKTWCGKDITTMTRDELEAALRQAGAMYQNQLQFNLQRSEFTTDLMRWAARRIAG